MNGGSGRTDLSQLQRVQPRCRPDVESESDTDLTDTGEVPPAVIGRNIDSHPNYVGERCRLLAKYGLVDRRNDGYYALTADGRNYLAGDLDADQLTAGSN